MVAFSCRGMSYLPRIEVNTCDIAAPRGVTSVQMLRDLRAMQLRPSAPHQRGARAPARISGLVQRDRSGACHTHALLHENAPLLRRAVNAPACLRARAHSCAFDVVAPRARGRTYRVSCTRAAWLPSPLPLRRAAPRVQYSKVARSRLRR